MDGNQHTQSTYSYDPVGNTRTTSGPYPLQTNNPIRYAAGYQTTTGLTKYGARYYDPSTGRFTQQDPSGQETNPYAYAGDNPTNEVDLSGLDAASYGEACGKGAVTGVAVGVATGATETGVGALGAAALGCGQGLIAEGVNDLTDSDDGDLGSDISDGIDIVSSLL